MTSNHLPVKANSGNLTHFLSPTGAPCTAPEKEYDGIPTPTSSGRKVIESPGITVEKKAKSMMREEQTSLGWLSNVLRVDALVF